MHLAYVMTDKRGETDRLLTALSERLLQKGLRLAGIVQSNVECHDSELCDMDVKVLPDGETIRISQSLGAGARGCRLNPEALERAVGQVTAGLAGDPMPQILLVNKFGKHEADGRGMRPVIGEALSKGIPVICGVNKLNVPAFDDFAEGVAEPAPADLDALVAWVEQSLAD